MLKEEVQRSRTCQICGSRKENTYCSTCRKETSSDLRVSVYETIKIQLALKGKLRDGESGKVAPHYEFLEKEVPSGDPRLPDGVYISMTADRRNDMYHQVVKDAKTGKVLHEEHEPLSQHGPKKNS